MQNPKIWIFIIIFLTIGILYKNYSPNKNFDSFFDNFYIDQNLQLKSVKFPLKHIQSDKKITFITKENWIELGDYNLISNSQGLQKEFIKKEYITSDSVHVVFNFNVHNHHPKVIHKFKEIKNSWLLIETEDQTTGVDDSIKSK